jgi:hypothetical protein
LIHWFINSLIYLFIYVEYAESTLKYVKTRISKLSKISHIVIAFSRHKKESQMDTIVTVTMRYLGSYIELCVAQDYLIFAPLKENCVFRWLCRILHCPLRSNNQRFKMFFLRDVVSLFHYYFSSKNEFWNGKALKVIKLLVERML